MKKFLYFIFICILCVGFTACGGDDEPEPEPEKPFTWNGDWNDSNDPNYKPEGYNPIEGDWQLLKDPDIRMIFTKDFVINRAIYDVDYKIWKTSVWAESYAINDIGIKYTHSNALSIDEYKIIKENDIE
ncbi:MAG: hypothetical protein LBT43_20715, partial [Prevotella sp.]|nr:hypothetical protein [Prevotella sp.]